MKGSSSKFSELSYILFVVLFVVGVVIGFVVSVYSAQGGAVLGNSSGLSDLDKNFFLSVANAQLQFTSQNDWCTLGGGQWITYTTPAQLPVDLNQSVELRSKGAEVTYQPDGNIVASVIVVDRVACVVIPGLNASANAQ